MCFLVLSVLVPPLKASLRALRGLKEMELGDFEDESKAKKGAGQETKAKGPKQPRYIMPIVDNYRRTKKGRKLIAQEASKLLDLQAKTFPSKSMLNLDGDKITYKFNGATGEITKQAFLTKIGWFFDHYLVQVRRKVDFGARVQSWLMEAEKEMSKTYKFKKMQELVWLVAVTKLTNLKGLEECGEKDEDENAQSEHDEEPIDEEEEMECGSTPV